MSGQTVESGMQYVRDLKPGATFYSRSGARYEVLRPLPVPRGGTPNMEVRHIESGQIDSIAMHALVFTGID